MRELRVGDGVLRLQSGDIGQAQADAIVNAANSTLSGGGGVDGAIHRAGGPSILAECRRIGRCPTGSAVITGAGRLPARYVIHAVAPVWQGGDRDEAQLLRSAYLRSFELATERRVESIALASLGTGAYGYPIADAATIALRAALEHLATGRPPREVAFVLWNERSLSAFESALGELARTLNLNGAS
ncbi:MAG: macro domain-containing protein [Chloroflexota bacterium]|nr:macro domain-containing protein [Chloroflexota bacterium]